MRIAVCIYGFLRTCPTVINSYCVNLFQPYDTDVFLRCPDTYYSDSNQDPFWNSPTSLTKSHPLDGKVDANFLRKKIGNRLKHLHLYPYDGSEFKKMVADHQIDEMNFINQPAWRIISQYANIGEILKVKKDYEISNGFKYDLVVILRFDLIFYSKFNIDIVDLNKINYPASWGCGEDGNRVFGAASAFGMNSNFNDQVFIGPSDKMDSLIDLYPNVPTYYKEGMCINNETGIAYQFRKSGVEWCPSDFVTYELFRGLKSGILQGT